MDPTTQANYDKIASTHVDFEWAVDFAKKVISGSATHTLSVREEGVTEVVFDSLDLTIEKAQVEGQDVKFDLSERHPVMGSAVRVSLPSTPAKDSQLKVTVFYKTAKDAMALQWLAKEQTQGGKFPYLFSQCQPIYARSLAPLQDSPSVKITYTAKVTSVLPVLLSAQRVSPPSDGPAHGGQEVGKDAVTYTYNQPVPIPSYLIAIAAGNVVYRPFERLPEKTWTSGVWAEPELIDSAYWEFSADLNRFLSTAETIVPPYRFGVYDILVLPPSFPYGGMENACLTFLTPSLLVGDRTLVDVVVHELTHSWFGNGVTQAHSTHFWLNEGWTTYIERVLQQLLHGPAERGFSFLIGSKGMTDALKLYSDRPKYQRLVIQFEKGEDPDDAYSVIPYEKGANFLLYLERMLGGLDVFLPYARDYVSTYQGKSITTEQWKAHLFAYFEKHDPEKVKALNRVDWNAWFYGEGTELPVTIVYDTALARAAYQLAEQWNASRGVQDPAQLPFKESDMEAFNSNQKVVFLERLDSEYPSFPPAHIRALGSLYNFSSTPNAEVRLRFYELALKDPTSDAAKEFAEQAVRWVVGDDGTGIIKGRMKFCRPVFREASKVDKPVALKYFNVHKEAFHPIARRMIEKDLGLA